MNLTDRPLRRPDIETHVLPDGSCLLFDPEPCAGYVLDALGALVWDYSDGGLSCAEILAEVAELAPAAPHLRDDALAHLDQFAKQGLLVSPISA